MPPSSPRHRLSYPLLGALLLAGCGADQPHRPQRSIPKATSTPTAPPAAKPSRARTTRTITGQDILTRFGDVQVAITLKDGRITDVQPVTLPSDRPRSLFISQQAAPLLRSEVLTAQSARINLVSGATYTSDAWATSVQSAIDQAG